MASKQVLDGTRLNAFGINPNDLVIIGLDTNDGPEHPLFDERATQTLDDALVKNIRIYGVIEPVIVTKDGDRALVVAGRQRVRAAREANKLLASEGSKEMLVPVMHRRGDQQSLMGVMITENEHRSADDLKVKTSKLLRFLALGRTEQDAATAFGVSVTTIRNWLSVSEASKPVRDAVERGQINLSVAVKLAKLPKETQGEALKEVVAEGKPTTEKAARVAREKQSGKKEHDVPSKKELKAIFESSTNQDVSLDDGAKVQQEVLRWVLGLGERPKFGWFVSKSKVKTKREENLDDQAAALLGEESAHV